MHTEYLPEPSAQSQACYGSRIVEIRTRQVIVSILIQGKKYKETAEELNVSVNTVKTLLNYGVKQLRKQFPDTLLLIFYCIENDSLTL